MISAGDAGHESTDDRTAALRIARGACYVLFAYDVGLAIDLDEAQRRSSAATQRTALSPKRPTPYYFQYQPAPVRVTLSAPPVAVGARATETVVEALLYDFGAVSVQYSIPLCGPLIDLLALSVELHDNRGLLSDSRRVVEMLLEPIRPAVVKPSIADVVEDYAIYQIEDLAPPADVAALVRDRAMLLAQILRAERIALSPQEIDDALACPISFAAADRTLIDWNAALLFGRELDDVRAVLEFANVELAEMRFLDDRLDRVLDEAYETTTRRSDRMVPFFRNKAADLWRLARLQTDAAVLYEGVNNALKLLGDQFLARVHRLVSQRFHLADWDQSILRKLQTIESIYQKISDRNASRRMEVLEWIIILLIVVEVILMLWPTK
jgi:hypothetical protein